MSRLRVNVFPLWVLLGFLTNPTILPFSYGVSFNERRQLTPPEQVPKRVGADSRVERTHGTPTDAQTTCVLKPVLYIQLVVARRVRCFNH